MTTLFENTPTYNPLQKIGKIPQPTSTSDGWVVCPGLAFIKSNFSFYYYCG
jgi:hypothetical protein